MTFSGSKLWMLPIPLQVPHIPCGLLKLNSWGDGGLVFVRRIRFFLSRCFVEIREAVKQGIEVTDEELVELARGWTKNVVIEVVLVEDAAPGKFEMSVQIP